MVEAIIAWKGEIRNMFANATGSNRLLIGLGWPLIYFTADISHRLRHGRGVGDVRLRPGDTMVRALGGLLDHEGAGGDLAGGPEGDAQEFVEIEIRGRIAHGWTLGEEASLSMDNDRTSRMVTWILVVAAAACVAIPVSRKSESSFRADCNRGGCDA